MDIRATGATPAQQIERAKQALLKSRTPVDSIEARWSVEGTSLDSPVCGDGLVFASRDQKPTVSALNPDSGATVWEHDVHGAVTQPLLCRQGLVLVGGGDGLLHAYDPKSGDEQWSLPLSGGGRLMQDAKGTVYACGSNSVTAFDVAQMKVLWQANLPVAFEGGVAVGPDGFIYGGSGNSLYKLQPQTGEEVWHHDTGSLIRTRPTVDQNGVVYCGNIAGRLVAVGPDNVEKWSFPTKGFILTPAELDQHGAVYVGSCDRSVYCLDSETGKPYWTFETNGELRAAPTPSTDGMVYAVSDRNQVYGIDARTGQKRWDFHADSYVHNPLAADGQGRVFYGCNNFRIYGHEDPMLRHRLAEAELHPPDEPAKSIAEEDGGWLVIGDLRVKPD